MKVERADIKALAESFGKGDKAAFEKLYQEFHEKVYFFIIRIVDSPDTAEDLTSETFTTAFEHISQLKSGESFVGWLYSIAYSKCAKHLKELSRNISNDELEYLLEAGRLNEPILLPDDYTENEETKEQLKSIIDSLSPDMRAAVIMYYYDEMTIPEVAEALETNENNVSQKLYKARKRIKEKVEKLIGKDGLFAAVPMSTVLENLSDGVWIAAGTALAVGLTAGLNKASGGIGDVLLYITRKYWSKHKKSLAALLFSGVLLCAVVCCAFLMIRGSFHRQLHESYDAFGFYTVMLPVDNGDFEKSVSTDKTAKGHMYVYGRAGFGEQTFTYGAVNDPENLAHIPFEEGRLPLDDSEIAVDRTVLNRLGYSGRVGDSIGLDIGTFTLCGIIDEVYGKSRFWSELQPAYNLDRAAQTDYPIPVIFVSEKNTEPKYTLTMLDNIATDYRTAVKYTSVFGQIPGSDKEISAQNAGSGRKMLMNNRHIFVFAGIATIIAVLSVVAVLRNIFAERENTFSMLRKIGLSRSDIRTIYDIECFAFILLQALIGIALGVLFYQGIYSFEVGVLSKAAYSGLTDYTLVTDNTISPFKVAVIFSGIVMPLGYIFASLTSRLKVRHKNKKAASLSKSFAKTFSTRSVTAIQLLALTLICLGTMLGYMSITDNGKEFLQDLGYQPPQSTNFYEDFKFDEDNIEEFYHAVPPQSYSVGTFKIATPANAELGINDETADKIDGISTGTLPNTFIIDNDGCEINTTISTGNKEQRDIMAESSTPKGKAFLEEQNTLYALETKLADAKTIQSLEKYVTSGRIDIDALNSGKEVIYVIKHDSAPVLSGEITLCSAMGSSGFGIDELTRSKTKIGAVVRLPSSVEKILKYSVSGNEFYNVLTTASGAKALSLHNAAYTEIFSSEHIDGGLIPMSSEMELLSYSEQKRERFLAKASQYGSAVMIIGIMSLLGFAAYFNGIGMKIRLKEYEISVLRAVGTPLKLIRKKLLIDGVKIPLIAASAAFMIVKLIQIVTSKVYDTYINSFWSFNSKQLDALGQDDGGLALESLQVEEMQLDSYRDKLHYNFFLDDELWKVNPVIPIIIIFAVMSIITILLTRKSFRRFTPDIASSLSKGRKRQ
ncbi:sigma-70 family RNA polymerase sigma factor [Ruminococcus sp. NK3A76]|uniref:sigma-70 family RNA polymerase sigma factor n=1 Tax=Ruminococcus sp. NK3A76 TaxID=877411 RepID=UPI0018DDA156|nr:sigma-70 family RNA polymerase sigma factor [Ruminococcus sp. NK3A76]